jgi:hypothetical protein
LIHVKRLARNFALDEQLCELPTLRLTLERHENPSSPTRLVQASFADVVTVGAYVHVIRSAEPSRSSKSTTIKAACSSYGDAPINCVGSSRSCSALGASTTASTRGARIDMAETAQKPIDRESIDDEQQQWIEERARQQGRAGSDFAAQ